MHLILGYRTNIKFVPPPQKFGIPINNKINDCWQSTLSNVLHYFARILLRVDVGKWRETPRALLLVDHQAKVQQSLEFHGRTLSMHGRRGHSGTGNRRDAAGIHPGNLDSHIPVWFLHYYFLKNLLGILENYFFLIERGSKTWFF